ncbi:cysteine--1-D-myo-inosityl 2-amino-2-deoxy-alpha-D-glucopyranoside ligase [Actinomycetota bacterium]
MISWPTPSIPTVPGTGPAVTVHDTASGTLHRLAPGPVAGLYVCGITPYDATHMGHAATYVTFDLLGRALRDAGHEVRYVQNITDVDDPLLERADRDGVEWSVLATDEIELFREDMTALAVIPPDVYLGVVESMPEIIRDVTALCESGIAYPVETPDALNPGACDLYFDLSREDCFGSVSGWTREQMMAVFGERGGDPDRAGKRDALDPLLWRVEREGEPAWDAGALGRGRPGWHIECTAIALEHLGIPFTVQGGGTDLIFPHHEMSAVQAAGLTDERPFATAYVHQAMVGLHGEKMSKSKGNLVLVSKLRRDGVDPMAIRLALLAHHYRTEWEWTDASLEGALERLDAWRKALSGNGAADPEPVVAAIRAALANDLDSPSALAAVDTWAETTSAGDESHVDGAGIVARALDALLGVRL